MGVQFSSKPFLTDRKKPPDLALKPPRSDSYLDWNVLVTRAKIEEEIFLSFDLAARLPRTSDGLCRARFNTQGVAAHRRCERGPPISRLAGAVSPQGGESRAIAGARGRSRLSRCAGTTKPRETSPVAGSTPGRPSDVPAAGCGRNGARWASCSRRGSKGVSRKRKASSQSKPRIAAVLNHFG